MITRVNRKRAKKLSEMFVKNTTVKPFFICKPVIRCIRARIDDGIRIQILRTITLSVRKSKCLTMLRSYYIFTVICVRRISRSEKQVRA